MPRKWEVRAPIGIALLLLVVPMLILTGSTVGFQPSKLELVLALVAEGVMALLAMLMIALPGSIWRLGRPYSEVRHSLYLRTMNALFMGTEAIRLGLVLGNSADVEVAYRFESIEIELDGHGAPEARFNTRGGVVARTGSTTFYYPQITGLDTRKDFIEGKLHFRGVYGPAAGDFDVEWERKIAISLRKLVGVDGWHLEYFDQLPETHRLLARTIPQHFD